MKKEVMQVWVEALRSGKYQQTEASLKDKEGHCCLGVLCELAPASVGEFDKEGIFWTKSGNAMGILLDEVKQWADIDSSLGITRDGKQSLSRMNDRGVPFTEIADFIEANYERL